MARVCYAKKNPKHAVRLGFLVEFSHQTTLGLTDWRCRGAPEGPAQPVGLCARANSLSTRKLLAAQRSFGGAIGEIEQFPA